MKTVTANRSQRAKKHFKKKQLRRRMKVGIRRELVKTKSECSEKQNNVS